MFDVESPFGILQGLYLRRRGEGDAEKILDTSLVVEEGAPVLLQKRFGDLVDRRFADAFVDIGINDAVTGAFDHGPLRFRCVAGIGGNSSADGSAQKVFDKQVGGVMIGVGHQARIKRHRGDPAVAENMVADLLHFLYPRVSGNATPPVWENHRLKPLESPVLRGWKRALALKNSFSLKRFFWEYNFSAGRRCQSFCTPMLLGGSHRCTPDNHTRMSSCRDGVTVINCELHPSKTILLQN